VTVVALWAPLAAEVFVEPASGGNRRALRRGTDGWWRDDRDQVDPYWLVVDGLRVPDPRSRWQPEGLDGPTAVDDAGAFRWTDGGWRGFRLADAVLYELHVGTFSPEGTFAGVVDRLDHLTDLGVNAIELMPVATFPGRRGWGYDGALLGAVHHAYGDPDDLRRLVDACHARRIAVVLDVVYNHLGPTGNHLGSFGPYFTDRYPTPWGQAVNLDGPGSDEVRRFFIDNALQWVTDFHVDGLRLDAVHALRDGSAVHFLEQLAAEVHDAADQQDRTVWVIAESDLNDPRLVRPVDTGGYGLDAAWSDDFHHALHVALTDEHGGYYADFQGWSDVARCLEEVWVHAGTYVPSRQRRHGRPAGDVPRTRFLGYSQNHDQVGNRARGERLGHLVDRRRAEAAAAVVLTAPFVPMLFQGEEWAASTPFQFFTDHQDPAIAEATRDGRRAEFAGFAEFAGDVPDPQDPATFERSKLDWHERTGPGHAAMLSWYRRLIEARHAWPDLGTDGPTDTAARLDAHGRCLRVLRGSAELIVNAGDSAVAVPLGGLRVEVTNDDQARIIAGDLHLAPWCTAVCVPDDGE
jgi:maltooligosyltrehalose trehalohydrolase